MPFGPDQILSSTKNEVIQIAIARIANVSTTTPSFVARETHLNQERDMTNRNALRCLNTQNLLNYAINIEAVPSITDDTCCELPGCNQDGSIIDEPRLREELYYILDLDE